MSTSRNSDELRKEAAAKYILLIHSKATELSAQDWLFIANYRFYLNHSAKKEK